MSLTRFSRRLFYIVHYVLVNVGNGAVDNYLVITKVLFATARIYSKSRST